MNVCGRVLIKFYLQKYVVGQIWPMGCSLLTLDLQKLVLSKNEFVKENVCQLLLQIEWSVRYMLGNTA